MSTLSFADTVFALRFLRLLTMPYEKTAAFKQGVIDKDGKVLLKISELNQYQKESYTIFHRMVFNIRRLLQKVPVVGQSILTNYATALLLLKEHLHIQDDQVLVDCIQSASSFDILENQEIIPGLKINYQYILSDDIPHQLTGEMIFKRGTLIIIRRKSDKEFYGIPFYESTHIPTGQSLLVCSGDIATPTNSSNLIPPRDTKDQLFSPKKKKKKKNEKI